MFIICLSFVYHLFIICLTFVYHLFNICLTFVYHLFIICWTFNYQLFDICLSFLYHLFDMCLTFVYHMYICTGQLLPQLEVTSGVHTHPTVLMFPPGTSHLFTRFLDGNNPWYYTFLSNLVIWQLGGYGEWKASILFT